MTQHELIQFAEEQQIAPEPALAPWPILLVDDEADVHTATHLALKNFTIKGRKLAFTYAHSLVEAQRILSNEQDFAVAIIDVVMESDTAGLDLVRHIRQQLNNRTMRIILRTGQPGYAPEIDTIQQYDINDYHTKTELTQTRLYASLTFAIRSYVQLKTIETLAFQDVLVGLPNRIKMLNSI